MRNLLVNPSLKYQQKNNTNNQHLNDGREIENHLIAGGNSEYFKKRTADINGYKPLSGIWNNPIEIRNSEQYKLDSNKTKFFTSLIEDCRHSGTKLFIVCSPLYINFKQRDYSILVAEEIAKEKSIVFIDFTNDTSFINHPYLFDDASHLNAKVAESFTKKVIDRINDSLKLR